MPRSNGLPTGVDVVVIGGGPAGLLGATRCAEAGLAVLLLEEHRVIGEPGHCTGVVSLELGEFAKVPPEIVLNRLTRARLVSPLGAHADVTWTEPRSEEILAIDRPAFDRSLAREAAGAGVVIRTGARADRIELRDGAIAVAAGAVGPVRARACILACGVSYRFQRQLGLGLPAHVVHTAQLEVDALPSAEVSLHFGAHVAPQGFLWTVPLVRDGRHRMKVGVLTRGDAAKRLATFLHRSEVRGSLTAEPGTPTRRLLPLQPIPKTFGERVLVVGDAGGFTKPTTGGGVFYGLLTATLAAETLVEGFHAGRLDEAFLSRYERRWHDRLGQELRVADWLRDFAVKCTDAEIDQLVRAVAEEDVQSLLRRTARFNWHRDVIIALLKRPAIASLLFRSLFR